MGHWFPHMKPSFCKQTLLATIWEAAINNSVIPRNVTNARVTTSPEWFYVIRRERRVGEVWEIHFATSERNIQGYTPGCSQILDSGSGMVVT